MDSPYFNGDDEDYSSTLIMTSFDEEAFKERLSSTFWSDLVGVVSEALKRDQLIGRIEFKMVQVGKKDFSRELFRALEEWRGVPSHLVEIRIPEIGISRCAAAFGDYEATINLTISALRLDIERLRFSSPSSLNLNPRRLMGYGNESEKLSGMTRKFLSRIKQTHQHPPSSIRNSRGIVRAFLLTSSEVRTGLSSFYLTLGEEFPLSEYRLCSANFSVRDKNLRLDIHEQTILADINQILICLLRLNDSISQLKSIELSSAIHCDGSVAFCESLFRKLTVTSSKSQRVVLLENMKQDLLRSLEGESSGGSEFAILKLEKRDILVIVVSKNLDGRLTVREVSTSPQMNPDDWREFSADPSELHRLADFVSPGFIFGILNLPLISTIYSETDSGGALNLRAISMDEEGIADDESLAEPSTRVSRFHSRIPRADGLEWIGDQVLNFMVLSSIMCSKSPENSMGALIEKSSNATLSSVYDAITHLSPTWNLTGLTGIQFPNEAPAFNSAFEKDKANRVEASIGNTFLSEEGCFDMVKRQLSFMNLVPFEYRTTHQDLGQVKICQVTTGKYFFQLDSKGHSVQLSETFQDNLESIARSAIRASVATCLIEKANSFGPHEMSLICNFMVDLVVLDLISRIDQSSFAIFCMALGLSSFEIFRMRPMVRNPMFGISTESGKLARRDVLICIGLEVLLSLADRGEEDEATDSLAGVRLKALCRNVLESEFSDSKSDIHSMSGLLGWVGNLKMWEERFPGVDVKIRVNGPMHFVNILKDKRLIFKHSDEDNGTHKVQEYLTEFSKSDELEMTLLNDIVPSSAFPLPRSILPEERGLAVRFLKMLSTGLTLTTREMMGESIVGGFSKIFGISDRLMSDIIVSKLWRGMLIAPVSEKYPLRWALLGSKTSRRFERAIQEKVLAVGCVSRIGCLKSRIPERDPKLIDSESASPNELVESFCRMYSSPRNWEGQIIRPFGIVGTLVSLGNTDSLVCIAHGTAAKEIVRYRSAEDFKSAAYLLVTSVLSGSEATDNYCSTEVSSTNRLPKSRFI